MNKLYVEKFDEEFVIKRRPLPQHKNQRQSRKAARRAARRK